ncbi:MAG: DUF4416 family protein [Nitrospinota bacterium]
MGEFRPPESAKRFVGCIHPEGEDPSAVLERLAARFGPVEDASEAVPFTATDYYAQEMGAPLVRRFYAFGPLAPADALVDAKHFTQRLERDFSQDGRRRFNLDPGLLFAEKVVMATTKNYAHRIYLGGGVYADLAYIFRDGAYRPLPWTYPDLWTPGRIGFFQGLRAAYLASREASG